MTSPHNGPIRGLTRPHLRDAQPYVPGRPVRDVERAGAVRLGSNECPMPPSPRVLAAVQGAVGSIHRYPDTACSGLRQALAGKLGVDPLSLVFGAGTTELLELAVKVFVGPGDEVVYPWPSFAMYPAVAAGTGGSGVPVPLDVAHDVRVDAILGAVTPRTRMLLLANPNNPTGRSLGAAAFERLAAGLPAHVVLVCDEAYGDYTRRSEFPDALALVRARPATIILRTFSKVYGLAGLRIGYGIAAPDLVAVLESARQPFTVSTLAQVAAEAALGDDAYRDDVLALTWRGIRQLEAGLAALGLACTPSDANFVLFEVGPDAKALEQRLLRRGVIARSVAAFGLSDHLRVTCGLPGENARFLTALRAELGR